jgi:hypothetical protein
MVAKWLNDNTLCAANMVAKWLDAIMVAKWLNDNTICAANMVAKSQNTQARTQKKNI